MLQEIINDIRSFRYEVGVTPLSSPEAPCVAVVLYLLAIYVVIPKAMEGREPFKLKWITFFHNMFLCLLSVVMCSWTLVEVYIIWSRIGWWDTYADPDMILQESPVVFWCYLFYLTKYYELLDTVILALKKKPYMVLHVWHHTTVLFMFWMCAYTNMWQSWLLLVVNTFVHVFVYYYFAMAAIGVRVSWKAMITIIQMSQFVFDIGYNAPWPLCRIYGLTSGSWWVALYTLLVGCTYLYLFAQFYDQEYNRKKPSSKAS